MAVGFMRRGFPHRGKATHAPGAVIVSTAFQVQEYRGRQRALESGRAGGVDSSPKGSRGVGSSESTGESDWGKCDGGGGGAEEDGRGGAESGGGRDKEKEMTFVRLFSKNEDVDRLNEHELKRLEGEKRAEWFRSSSSS